MASARELIERTHSTWNARDQKGFCDLAGPTLDMTVPGGGPEDLAELYAVWNEAFPDNRAETLTIVAEGDRAALEGVFTGTHTGTMRTPAGDVAPTGRSVSLGYTLHIIEGGGRMTSYHLYFDRVDLLTQLGLMPAAAAAGA